MGMAKKEWKALKTLLIVGEGYHDEAFLNHVKRPPWSVWERSEDHDQKRSWQGCSKRH